MTTLEAVNDILRRVGSLVVPSLDTGGTSVQAQAERQLDDVDVRIQTLGWHWNKRRLTLTPDEGGEIPVASIPTPRGSLLEIDTVGPTSGMIEVVVEGGKLTRLPDMTTTFDADLEVEVIERLAFSQVPLLFAAWMVAEAAFDLNRRYMQDVARAQALASERMQARVNAMRQVIRLADVNLLDSTDVRAVHGRRRLPYWSTTA